MPPYRIEWLDEAKADVRALDQPTAMRLLEGILRFAQTGSGKVRPASGPEQNRLPISFEALEESDGAAVQIVFAGDLNTPISFEGTFVGVPKPEDVAQKFQSFRSVGFWCLGAGCLMVFLYIVARFRKMRSTALSFLCGALVAEAAAVIFMYYGSAVRSIPLPLLR